MTTTPHDALFRFAFTQLEHADGVLRSMLPAEVVSTLRWETLRLEESDFIDSDLAEQRSDLVYRIEHASGDEARIAVLLEHQSGIDPRMPLRIVEYVVGLWRRLFDEEGPRLPVVIPIVLALLGRAWLTAFGRLVLFCLMEARRDGFVRAIEQHAQLFVAVSRSPDGLHALRAVMTYIQEVADADPQQVAAALGTGAGSETREAFMTIAERLINKGRQEGARRILTKQLELKFGKLTESAQARIEAASADQIDGWVEAVLTAKDVAEVFER